MFFIRLIFYVAISCSVLHAQSVQDSLVRFSDLDFSTEQERELFTKYLIGKDSSVLIEMFLIPMNKSDVISAKMVTDKVNQCVSYINDNFSATKANAKKTKQVYDYVHKTFLKVYKLHNSFGNVFNSGEYNCVSASALYAFIFSKTNIPYVIKEKPTHVYLYAFPNTDKILIETTSPDFGYYQFNNQFVDKYVQRLYESKQITKEEYEATDVNDLFNKYFFTDKDISLRQLLGLQFFNYGIFSYDKKEYKEALDWFKKAYIIYPSKSVYFLMQNSLYEQLSNGRYIELTNVSDFLLLLRFAEQENKESNRKEVLDEFIRMKDAQLINANNIDLFRKSYQLISREVGDSSLKKDIDFVYWYEMSRVSILSGNNDSVDFYLKKAYELRPNNIDLRSLITHRALNKVSNYSDSKIIFDDLQHSIKDYPFLKEHEKVNLAVTSCYLDLSFQSYAQNKSSKGEEYLNLFEKSMKEEYLHSINQRFVERTYSEACAYYYRIGNKTKAKSMITQGLKYAPDSFGLKERLRQLN